jgi:hypothetical protein
MQLKELSSWFQTAGQSSNLEIAHNSSYDYHKSLGRPYTAFRGAPMTAGRKAASDAATILRGWKSTNQEMRLQLGAIPNAKAP